MGNPALHLQEYMAIGRKDTLVICQKKVHLWLDKSGLPKNIFIEHYYDVAGKDVYKHVALGILVGRPAPGPRSIEEIAGALSGEWQQAVPPNLLGFIWYKNVNRGIRVNGRGDDGIVTVGDWHPASLTEAVRFAYCEGELINAHGRLRAINRTAEFACEVRWLFDTACRSVSTM
jgi:hypothetical protein